MQRSILSGKWRHRPLVVQTEAPCRPTLGIQRERLFDWLQGEIQGADCLDLFGGSGALGLEALSRGARYLRMFENFKPQAELIRSAWQKEIDQGWIDLRIEDARSIGKIKADRSFDLVFLDPPFTKNYWQLIELALVQQGWMNKKSLLCREIPQGYMEPMLSKPWKLLKEKITKSLRLQLYLFDA